MSRRDYKFHTESDPIHLEDDPDYLMAMKLPLMDGSGNVAWVYVPDMALANLAEVIKRVARNRGSMVDAEKIERKDFK